METEWKWIIELESLSGPSRRPSAAAEDIPVLWSELPLILLFLSLVVIAFGWSSGF